MQDSVSTFSKEALYAQLLACLTDALAKGEITPEEEKTSSAFIGTEVEKIQTEADALIFLQNLVSAYPSYSPVLLALQAEKQKDQDEAKIDKVVEELQNINT